MQTILNKLSKQGKIIVALISVIVSASLVYKIYILWLWYNFLIK